MSTYEFIGKISPEIGVLPDFPLSIPSMSFKAIEADICFEATILISGLKVSITARNLDENADLLIVKNYVRDAVMVAVDLLNYLWGQGCDVEITLVIKPNGEKVYFSAVVQELYEAREERPLTFEQFGQLWQVAVKSQHLRRAFGNLREAIRVPEDTGFFCYRAVESIRQHFWEEGDRDNTQSWKRLRDALRIDKSWIDALKRFADEQRHGGTPYMSGEARVSAMQRAWKVVDRFCVYLHRDYRDCEYLPESEFDQLKES